MNNETLLFILLKLLVIKMLIKATFNFMIAFKALQITCSTYVRSHSVISMPCNT